MKRFYFLVCLIAMLSGYTESYAQKGFCFGVDFNGGMTLEDKWFQLNKPQASANLIAGYQFNPYLFLGLGMGVGHFSPLTEDKAIEPGSRIDPKYTYQERNMFQLIFREKVNFLDKRISPFTSFDFGYPVNGKDVAKDNRIPYFLEPGLGCDFRLGKRHSLSLTVGYRWQSVSYKQVRYHNYFDYIYTYPLQKTAGVLTLHVGYLF
ncbi:MAG: hypothetical protein IKI66_07285 [Bacteroidales bacterium]|nr:hypothetical protein [Bacteroidales bacterium]